MSAWLTLEAAAALCADSDDIADLDMLNFLANSHSFPHNLVPDDLQNGVTYISLV